MPSLEFDVGGTPKLIEIDRAGTLGRDPAVPYYVDHPTISRRHAEFYLSEESVVLVDLGSANGTRVNEETLTGPRALRDGDQVEFGRIMMRFRSNRPAEAEPVSSTQITIDDPLNLRLADRDALLDELFQLTEESSLKGALVKALSCWRNAMPQLGYLAIFDRVSGDIHAAQPDASLRSAELLLAASAAIDGEGRAVSLFADTRANLARAHGLPFTPQLMQAVDLGTVIGKPLAIYLEADNGLDENSDLNVVLAARALRAVVRHFDRAQIANISDEDLKLAQRIQRRLIKSQPPPVPGYKVALSYTPALAVGGDFYDLQITPSGELAIVIGDVSGKGVSASLYMAQIMAALRQFIPLAKGPGELLITMNGWLQEVLEPGLFATMAACFLDPRKNSCRLAQAGHAPPVLRSAARKVIEMSSEPGMPLGAMSEMKPKEQRLALSPGDLLLFTTDGVEEGENAFGEAFGNDRRDAALKAAQGAFAVTLAVREALLGFVGSTVSTDDMTIIAVQRED